MVAIVQESVRVYSESVLPAIKLRIQETFPDDVILLGIEGNVQSDDGKHITILFQIPPTNRDDRQIYARGISDYRQQQNRQSYERDLYFTLTEKVLDYLEERREKNAKHDVILGFNIVVTFMQHSIAMGDYAPVKTQGAELIAKSFQKPYRADTLMNMLVPKDTSGQIITFSQYSQPVSYAIKSSDWVNDFQKPFGIGSFLVVEVPLVELPKIDANKLTPEQKTFKERLDKAYELLPEMEKELRKGEWGDVVKSSRGVFEVFKKGDISQYMKDMITTTTSLNGKSADALKMSIDNLYGYSNELHHSVTSQGKTNEVYTGGKEDAYMAYVVAASLTNLLAKKFTKSISNKMQGP